MTSKESNALKERFKETSPLKVMFPEEEVELFGGKIVKVRPLSLKDIPKVIASFRTIMKIASETKDMADVASFAVAAIMDLVPFCVDCKPEEIPLLNVPEILTVIVKQNLSEASVGNWTTLISTFANLIGDQGILPKVSKKS